MARIFIADGREFPDPDPNMAVADYQKQLADFMPELHNAEVKEFDKDGNHYVQFIKKVGTKGGTKKKEKRVIEIEARVPKDYKIEYWYEKDQEMPESEREHVKELLEQGYTSGELVYHDEKGHMNRGWWDIKAEESGL